MSPVDGGGNISRPSSPIPVTGQTAEAPQVNVPLDDIYSIMNLFPFLDGRKAWRGIQNLNGYKMGGAANGTAPQDYVTLSQVQALIAAIPSPPPNPFFPGFLQADTTTSIAAPSGWIFANGAEVLRATFPLLWDRVRTGNNIASTQAAKSHGQYGPGNGSTTFTLPNLYADEGYFIRPISSGRAIGSVQSDAMQRITGQVSASGNWNDLANYQSGAFGQPAPGGVSNVPTQGSNPLFVIPFNSGNSPGARVSDLETRPKNIAYPVLIKT